MSESKFNGSILVIGTGKIGAPTVRTLAASKIPNVHVLVRDEEKAKKSLGLDANADIKFVKGDLYDLASVEAALKGIDRVFLIHPTGDPKNVEAVAKLAKAANVKLFVQISGIGVSPSVPKNTIPINHYKGEEAIEAAGLPFVFLRCPFFFQNYLDEAQGIKHSGSLFRPIYGSLPSVDARDIADAAITLLTAPDPSKYVGRTYILGTNSYTEEEVAKLLSAKIGKEIKLIAVDDATWYHGMQQFGVPEHLAWLLVKLYQQLRLSPVTGVYGDFKILTGKDPRTLGDFFAENKAAFV